ncbi:MAG TPA: phosphoribosyltransferase family protein, partial [Polyangiaceae bacterium]
MGNRRRDDFGSHRGRSRKIYQVAALEYIAGEVFLSDRIAPLLTSEQIAERVQELGADISRDYQDLSLVLVCVLKGSFVFAADLARALSVPVR